MLRFFFLSTLILLTQISQISAKGKKVRLGYFEAGSTSNHQLLRKEFNLQLEQLLPDSVQFAFVPNGYRSAEWKREDCRRMASELADSKDFDILIAIGPWVVEDLIKAGFTRPIVAMSQVDPVASQFVAKNGQPVIPNLTFQAPEYKIEEDLQALRRIMPLKKVGLLFFPSDSLQKKSLIRRAEHAGRQLGFETVYGEGYDNSGTYAYFKALNTLPKDVDAVYLGPMSGMDIQKINQFFRNLRNLRKPSIAYEGRFLVDRGAMASNNAYTSIAEARLSAYKTVQIINGATPSDLPTLLKIAPSPAINVKTAKICKVDIPIDIRIEGGLVLDLLPTSGDYLSLADAVSRALQANPDYLATYDNLIEAEQLAKTTLANYLPHIGIEGYIGYRDDNTLNNTVEQLSNQSFSTSITFKQEIFSLETLRRIRTANISVDLARTNQIANGLLLEKTVNIAYLQYLEALELLKVEQKYREVSERYISISEVNTTYADQSKSDLLRWQAEQQNSVGQILLATGNLRATEAFLLHLLNLDGNSRPEVDSSFATIRAFYDDYELLSKYIPPEKQQHLQHLIYSSARTHNPSLVLSDQRLTLQKSLLRENKASFWPSLALEANYNLTDELDDNIGSIVEKSNSWSVYGRFSLPLFLGSSRFHKRKALQAKMSEIEFMRDAKSIELAGKIGKQVSRLLTTLGSLPRLQRSQELATNGMSMVATEYEAGGKDISSFLESYRTARQSELNAIHQHYQYLIEMAELTYSAGWSTVNTYQTFRDEFRSHIAK